MKPLSFFSDDPWLFLHTQCLFLLLSCPPVPPPSSISPVSSADVMFQDITFNLTFIRPAGAPEARTRRWTHLCPAHRSARRVPSSSGHRSPGSTAWMSWSGSRGWAWPDSASWRRRGSCPCSPQSCFLKNQHQLALERKIKESDRTLNALLLVIRKKSIGLWRTQLADTVPVIPRLNGSCLNEKIKTCNLCTGGILVLIAVEGLKEFQESISRCYTHWRRLTFLS